METPEKEPLVSIITPFLNAEKYFEECIQSVIAQQYENWELVLVDDGSKDASTAIAKKYARDYPTRIVYLEHDNHANRGASASRNLGIEKAHGNIIAFLDADDIYLPLKLSQQVPILLAHAEVGMMYSETEYWYSWSGTADDQKKDWIWKPTGITPNTVIAPPNLLSTFLNHEGSIPCMGSVLARKSAILASGGWENSFTHIYTDQVFHAKMAFHHPILVASGCWDRYRQHPESSCHQVERANKTYLSRYNFMKWLRTYLLAQGVDKESELWKTFTGVHHFYRYKYAPEFQSIRQKVKSFFR